MALLHPFHHSYLCHPVLIISQGPMNPEDALLILLINLSSHLTLLKQLLNFVSLSRISPINIISSEDEDSAVNTVLCPTWAAQCRFLQSTWKQESESWCKHWRMQSKENDYTEMFTITESPRIPSGTCFSSLDICFLASVWALKYWLMWVKSHLLRLVIVLFSSEVISLQKESSALSFHTHQVFMHSRAYPAPGSFNRNNRQVLTITPQKSPNSCTGSLQLRSERKGQAAASVEHWPCRVLISPNTGQSCTIFQSTPTPSCDWGCWEMGRKTQKHTQETCIKRI